MHQHGPLIAGRLAAAPKPAVIGIPRRQADADGEAATLAGPGLDVSAVGAGDRGRPDLPDDERLAIPSPRMTPPPSGRLSA
jgi:hypothetical protein